MFFTHPFWRDSQDYFQLFIQATCQKIIENPSPNTIKSHSTPIKVPSNLTKLLFFQGFQPIPILAFPGLPATYTSCTSQTLKVEVFIFCRTAAPDHQQHGRRHCGFHVTVVVSAMSTQCNNVGKAMSCLPPMIGNGNHTTYKNGDDWFMALFYPHYSRINYHRCGTRISTSCCTSKWYWWGNET